MSEHGPPPHFARIISLRVKPEDLGKLLEIYRTSSMPMVSGLPGLITIAGVASRHTGHASSITVWETAEDRERGGISTESAENLSQYAPLMIGTYLRDAFDVPVFRLRLKPDSNFSMLLGRITTEDVEPQHWEAATTSLRHVAHSLAESAEDGYGVMLFESQAMARTMLIELASSQHLLNDNALATRASPELARPSPPPAPGDDSALRCYRPCLIELSAMLDCRQFRIQCPHRARWPIWH